MTTAVAKPIKLNTGGILIKKVAWKNFQKLIVVEGVLLWTLQYEDLFLILINVMSYHRVTKFYGIHSINASMKCISTEKKRYILFNDGIFVNKIQVTFILVK